VVSSLVGLVNPAPAATPTNNVNTVSQPLGIIVGTGAAQVSPSGLPVGFYGSITIQGAGLDQVSSVAMVPATLVTLGTPTVSPDTTQLTMTVTVDPSATPGPRSIVLQGPAGTAFATPFAGQVFISVMPVIASISPILAPQGTSFTLSIRGTNLKFVQSVVATPGAGMSIAAAPTWTTDSFGELLTVPVVISAQAPTGPSVIQLVVPGAETSGDASAANTFTVTSP
jgi:hypothetical protein